MRATKSVKSPPSPTSSLVSLLFPLLLFAFYNTCSSSGALSRQPLPRLHLGKDFTVGGHRLLLSNKQSGTSGCVDPSSCTSTQPSFPCLLIPRTPKKKIQAHLSRARTAVVPCKFYMIGIFLFPPSACPMFLTPPSYRVAY